MLQASKHSRRIFFVSILTCLVVIAVCTWNWQTVRADDCGVLNYQDPQYFALGGRFVVGVAIADFNKDGLSDLAVTREDNVASGALGTTVRVWFGDGAGNYPTQTTLEQSGAEVHGLVVGDFNNDTNLDVAGTGFDGNVYVYLGTGTGGFSGAHISPANSAGRQGFRLAVADFNNDAKLDLVTMQGDNSFSVLLGDGTGSFPSAVRFTNAGLPGIPLIKTADLNSDGKADVVLSLGDAFFSNQNVAVFYGDGNGGFNITQGGGTGITIDFDFDGNPDQVIETWLSLVLLVGDGAGRFSQVMTPSAPGSPASSVDVNGDGFQDLITFTNYQGLQPPHMNISLGNSQGGFSAPIIFRYPVRDFYDISVGDVNQDNKLDIVFTTGEDGNVVQLLNDGNIDVRPPRLTVADITVIAVESSGAIAHYPVSVTDNSGSATLNCSIPSGSNFPIGVTMVTCTASDACGNNSSASLQVTVVDEPPVLSLPNDLFVPTAMPSGQVVNYSATATDVISGLLPVSCSPASGSTFPMGQVTVTCSATDGGGHTSTGSFKVSLFLSSIATFQAARNFNVGSNPFQIAVADFNKDGKPDMAVTSGVGVGILLGDGTGDFSASTFLPSGFSSTAVNTADFNGDGNADLAVFGNNSAFGNANIDGVLHIYLGNGTGGFASGFTFPNLGMAFGLAVGDLNHDQKTDLVISIFSPYVGESATVAIFLGDGAGGFSGPVTLLLFGAAEEGILSGGIAVADFDSDGNSDLAVSVSSFFDGGFETNILSGDGQGNFPTVSRFLSGRDVITGDFNQDGKLDLAGAWGQDNVPVIINFGQETGSVHVLGDGMGSFSERSFQPFYSWVYQISDVTGWSALARDPQAAMRTAAADFNFDGSPDLVTSATNKISILLGNGTGSFSLPIDFAVGSNPVGVTVADFNLDGKPDIATPNYSDGSVSVLLNSTYQTAIGVNSTVVVNNTTFTFDNVTAGGTTAVTPIDPATVGQVPGGFAVSNTVAYEIATTASFTGSVTLAFKVPDPISLEDFNSLAILHNENGSLVDVTATTPARDYATRTIYATTTSFSPFYLARRGPHIRTLFDQTKAHKSGSTIHIKLQVLNASSTNVSSSSTTLTVRDLKRMSGNTTAPLADSSNEDPDYAFRYEPALGGQGGGYAFKLKSTGFAPGQYVLSFYVGNDRAFFYTVKFEVR